MVEALLVDADIARRLDIDTTAPCLSMTRRTSSDEHLVRYARLIHPGNRHELRSSLRRRRDEP